MIKKEPKVCLKSWAEPLLLNKSSAYQWKTLRGWKTQIYPFIYCSTHLWIPTLRISAPSNLILSWLSSNSLIPLHFDEGLAGHGVVLAAVLVAQRGCEGLYWNYRLVTIQTETWITSNRPLIGNIFRRGASWGIKEAGSFFSSSNFIF